MKTAISEPDGKISDSKPAGSSSKKMSQITDQIGKPTVVGLKAHECKWPIGRNADNEITFCAERAIGPYCAKHQKASRQAGTALSPKILHRSVRRYL